MTRGPRGLWLRWSWRDLRRHWVAVAAISFVMAIGIGVYAGFGSTSTWRRLSNDESFAALAMHDLRVTLSPGTFVSEGDLARAVTRIEDVASIEAYEERLVVDNQVDASTDSLSILVPARIVGMSVSDEASVDRVWIRDGSWPATTEGVLEVKFAESWGLPASGQLTLAGNNVVTYSGLGMIPDDFFYQGPEGSILSDGELAPLYLPLATAQEMAQRPGQVNDLVLTLADDANRQRVISQLDEALADAGVSATISTQDESEAFRILYEDIDTDQKFWNALAALILGAAALAAFNLVSRIVEAQRREIGIGMALGVPQWKLAIRPLLVGFQVAVLGTVAGIGVGLLVGDAMQNLLQSFLPLPEYRTPLQVDVFARAAMLGLAIPILASALPLWRALRVEPIEAIRTGHLTAKTSRLTDFTGALPLPGSTLTNIPIRNFLRTPRRTLLTAVGVGAAITALVAVLGMLDSFGRTIDKAGSEFTRGDEDRVLVLLDTFYPVESDVVASIAEAPTVETAEPALRLPATARSSESDESLDLLVDLIDFDTATWTPGLDRRPAGVGIIIAQKAADDLSVTVGESIRLRHPVATGPNSFSLVESELEVVAIHANPLRSFAYLDLDAAPLFGLDGQTNIVHVFPRPETTAADVQRDVFGLEGVTSSQAVARMSEGFDKALDQFVGILAIAAAAVLVLALLIAFNASRITIEERRREHATMRAFGLPVRTIMGTIVRESILVGLVATAIGIGAGAVILRWMIRSLAATTQPDLGIEIYIAPRTFVIAAAVGLVAVAVAPLFLTRRVQKMDIPDTLRVME